LLKDPCCSTRAIGGISDAALELLGPRQRFDPDELRDRLDAAVLVDLRAAWSRPVTVGRDQVGS